MERSPGEIIQGKATADGGKTGLSAGRASVPGEPQKTATAPVPAHRADQAGRAVSPSQSRTRTRTAGHRLLAGSPRQHEQ